MSPVSQLFHTIVTVSIGLNTQSRVGTYIPWYKMSMLFVRALKLSFIFLINLATELLFLVLSEGKQPFAPYIGGFYCRNSGFTHLYLC